MDNTIQKRIKSNPIKGMLYKIKHKFTKAFTDKEYKIAEEYIINDIDVVTMEKDLLLRGLKYKPAKRIINASIKLRELSNLSPATNIYIDKELEGGILDGVRRS